jgi:hypothetical protein
MTVSYRWLGGVALLGLALPLHAQEVERPWLLEGAGAYVFLSGDYADIAKNGGAAGGLLGYRFTSRFWLMGSFASQWHEGETDLPSWTNYNYFGMLGYDALEPGFNGDIILYAGAGGVSFDPRVEEQSRRTYFGLNGGLKIVYDFSRQAALTLNAAAIVAFAEQEFIGGSTWLFPVGLGIAFHF